MTDLFDTPPTEVDNPLEQLVGEGKKFKTAEDLARGKLESDNFIRSLTAELAELRNDYLELREEAKTKASLEDLIDQYSRAQKPTDGTTTTSVPVMQQPSIDPNQIKSLVSEEIQNTRKAEQESANFEMVQNKLKERFGSNYTEALNSQMTELGLSAQVVNEMARTQPKMLIKALGLEAPIVQADYQAPPRSTNHFSPKPPQKPTWSYYQEIKKNDPKLYYSSKIQNQMHKDAIRLGAEFQDGNW